PGRCLHSIYRPERGAAMMRAFYGIALGSLLVLTGSIVGSSQGGSAQPNGFTNLQVWPVDTPRAVVLNFMNAFDRSLGVECNYCHVQRASGMTPQAHHVAAAIDDERRHHPLPCPAIDHKINWVG